MNWKRVKLSEICHSISDGDHQPPPKTVAGIPFVTISDITNTNQFDFSSTMFVPQEYYDNLDSKRKPEVSDILYSVVGSFGIPVYMKEAAQFVFQRHIAILRPDKEKVEPQFLYYTMLSRDFYMKADAVAIGAAQRTVSLTALRNIEINVPPVNVQKRIADTLSTYDDLIENNQKQIKLLEEATQRLYKAWFVDLRFPGYEDVAIVDGVPEGWNYLPLDKVISYEIGGGWGEDTIKEKYEKPAFVIRGTDFNGLTHGNIKNIPYRYHTESNLLSRTLMDGDIIFEVSGGSKTEGVARVVLIRTPLLEAFGETVICASFCKLIRFEDVKLSQYMYDTFSYLRTSGKTAEYDKKSASSIVNYRWKDFLSQQKIIIPSEIVIQKYNSIAENYYYQILCKSKTIETLNMARDRLIPKLMSGELEV